MSDASDLVLHEEYSANENYMYEVYKNTEDMYDLWIFRYSLVKKGFFMYEEHRNFSDNLEVTTARGDALMIELEESYVEEEYVPKTPTV